MLWKKLRTGDRWQQAASSICHSRGTGLLARNALCRLEADFTRSRADSPVAVYMLSALLLATCLVWTRDEMENWKETVYHAHNQTPNTCRWCMLCGTTIVIRQSRTVPASLKDNVLWSISHSSVVVVLPLLLQCSGAADLHERGSSTTSKRSSKRILYDVEKIVEEDPLRDLFQSCSGLVQVDCYHYLFDVALWLHHLERRS